MLIFKKKKTKEYHLWCLRAFITTVCTSQMTFRKEHVFDTEYDMERIFVLYF
jgi:hypothetical protein